MRNDDVMIGFQQFHSRDNVGVSIENSIEIVHIFRNQVNETWHIHYFGGRKANQKEKMKK